MVEVVLRGGRLVLPWGEAEGNVAVAGGRIVAVGAVPDAGGAEVVDCRGLHVLPGLVDPHVHLREPGDPSVETLESGTRGAALGGLTSVFDMPNTSPSVTTAEMVAWKRARVAEVAWCDVGLYVGASRANLDALASLEALPGVCGIKVFAGSSTGDLLIEDDETLERVMRGGRRRVSYHSEDEYRLRERRAMFAGGGSHALHAEWRDVECALLGTRRLAALARRTGRPMHVLHVSTAEELDFLAGHRAVASVEVLVNHLTQWAPEAYESLGAYAVMNPPIRDRRHWEAAWAAVSDGRVDCVGSDHAPHARAAKERPWPDTAAGLTGVQTLVPIMLDHVSQGRLSLGRLAELMSAGPARVYGAVTKGRIAVGHDADLTVVDMGAERVVEESWLASPCGWSPFVGRRCRGWAVTSLLRGAFLLREGALVGGPRGRPVVFEGEGASPD